MTIRTIDSLTQEIEAGKGVRGSTGTTLQDILDSVKGVGGVMFAENVDPVPVTTSWAPITVMTGVRNTRGVVEDLSGGLFTIGAGCDGSYATDLSFVIAATVPGWIDIGITKNGQAPFTKMHRTFLGGDEKTFVITDGISLAENDTIGLGIRASGNAPTQMSILDAMFRIVRA